MIDINLILIIIMPMSIFYISYFIYYCCIYKTPEIVPSYNDNGVRPPTYISPPSYDSLQCNNSFFQTQSSEDHE